MVMNAHSRGIPVIADDTIGTGINLNALPYVDLIFTSLTKSFAGRGDVMGGSLMVSPHSLWSPDLLMVISTPAPWGMVRWPRAGQSRREPTGSAAGSPLPAAGATPGTAPGGAPGAAPADCANCGTLMRNNAGHGCLLSFVLNDATRAQQVFDALRVSKGQAWEPTSPWPVLTRSWPLRRTGLGSQCGVPAHLLRVSVGLEDPDELWQRFEQALKP